MQYQRVQYRLRPPAEWRPPHRVPPAPPDRRTLAERREDAAADRWCAYLLAWIARAVPELYGDGPCPADGTPEWADVLARFERAKIDARAAWERSHPG